MNGYRITNQNSLHFITPTVVGWIDVFTRKKYKDIIVDSLNYSIQHKGLLVHSYVIMSNHLHLIVSAREGLALSDLIRDFKSYTASVIIKEIIQNPKESRQVWMSKLMKYYGKYESRNTKFQFWKKDNHPVELFSPKWIKARFDYIHYNPVQAGLVELPEHYVYSSAKYYVKNEEGLVKIAYLDADYIA
jgi:REP element-mobilizing transposase RayT